MESEALFQVLFTELHEESVYAYYSELDVKKLVSRIHAVNHNVMPGMHAGT
jgi:hypothetical protein